MASGLRGCKKVWLTVVPVLVWLWAAPLCAGPAAKAPPAPAAPQAVGSEQAKAFCGPGALARNPTGIEDGLTPGTYIPSGYHHPLRVDGNFPARLTRLNANGTPLSARARVIFVQKGNVVASARSDEWGHVQMMGLSPGEYSVLVGGRGGFAAYRVHVDPFTEGPRQSDKRSAGGDQAGAASGVGSLEISLVPPEEFPWLKRLVEQKDAARAVVLQEGKHVQTLPVQDDWCLACGDFKPGVYSLLAAGVMPRRDKFLEEGFYAHSLYYERQPLRVGKPAVRTGEYRRGASPFSLCGVKARQVANEAELPQVNISPISISEFELLEKLMNEDLPAGEVAMPPGGEAAPAGGGGGGGGFAALMGAAGLGLGVGGLAGSQPGGGPYGPYASPFVPSGAATANGGTGPLPTSSAVP